MKNYFRHCWVALGVVFWGISGSHAAGHVDQLYLCDLGITNPDRTNRYGVDYVEYTQNSHKYLGQATPTTYSAATVAAQQIVGYDRWKSNFGIDNVYFNLDSEFYGSSYYLEYCFTWDRLPPMDNIQYTVKVSTAMPIEVPYTTLNTDSKCSLVSLNSGVQSVNNAAFDKTSAFEMILLPNVVGMRCTIRLSLQETAGGILRPHNNDLGAVDPQVRIQVTP